MNPFNNRWLALFVVAGFLFLVAELVGTGEHGGVLAQATQSRSDEGSGEGAGDTPVEVITHPSVVEDVPEDVSEDVAEEDEPQVVPDDEGADTDDFAAVDEVSEPDMAADAPVDDALAEDDSGEE